MDLKERIPRVPHWRWVLFCGEDHPNWDDPMAQLARYLREEDIDVGLSALESPEGPVKRAIKIYKSEPPIRKVIEKMLYERCSMKLVADALFHKFKEDIGKDVVEEYAKYFYDVEVLNNYELAKFYEKSGQKIPDPPPVPAAMKEAYIAYLNGVDADLNIQEAMMHMFQTSFFRAQELKEYGWVADEKIMRFQKNAMDIAKQLAEGMSIAVMPKEFDIVIEYPDNTAVSMAEVLDGYDPDENPNSEIENG